MNCEICDKGIDNYWGYLSDFYPEFHPSHDRSNDQTLWGIQVASPGCKMEYHYYCSEEHAKEGEGNLGYKVVGEVADA